MKLLNCFTIHAFLFFILCSTCNAAQSDKKLIDIINSNNIKELQEYIQSGGNLNIKYEQGLTPLMISVIKNKPDITELLIRSGADIHAKSDAGKSFLYYAGGNKNFPVIEVLSKVGLDTQLFLDALTTELIRETERGNIALVKQLLDTGANINEKDTMGNTALMHALKYLHRNNVSKIAHLLLDRGADVNIANKDGTTPLMIAADKQNLSIVSKLLNKGANPNAKNKNGLTAFIAASAPYRPNDNVRNLIASKQTNISHNNVATRNMIFSAVIDDDFEAIKTLANAGINFNYIDKIGTFPLYRSKSAKMTQLLIDSGADVNFKSRTGKTALFAASINTAPLLIKKGINIDAKDFAGNTALMENEYLDVQKLLINNKANINAKNNEGQTALMLAKFGRKKFFLDQGADFTLKDIYGHTVLHYAVKEGEGEIIKLLLSKGANINSQTDDGYTPLMIAILVNTLKMKSIDYFKLLITENSQLNLKNKHGYTAFILANKNNNTKLTSLLAQKGADTSITPANIDLQSLALSHSSEGTYDIAKYYLEHPENRELSPLIQAAKEGDSAAVKSFLLQYPPEKVLNYRLFSSAFILSFIEGHDKIVQIFLDHGITPSIQNSSTFSAIMMSKDLQEKMKGREKIYEKIMNITKAHPSYVLKLAGSLSLKELKKAVKENNDLMYKDIRGRTTLMYAITDNNANDLKNVEMLNYLLQNKVDINAQDKEGKTALMFAVTKRCPSAVEFLLKNGADINIQDNAGNTALMYAVSGDFMYDYLNYLFEYHADINLKNKNGLTALFVLEENLKARELNTYDMELRKRIYLAKKTDQERSDFLASIHSWQSGLDKEQLLYSIDLLNKNNLPMLFDEAFMLLSQASSFEEARTGAALLWHIGSRENSGRLLATALLGDLFFAGKVLPQDFEKASYFYTITYNNTPHHFRNNCNLILPIIELMVLGLGREQSIRQANNLTKWFPDCKSPWSQELAQNSIPFFSKSLQMSDKYPIRFKHDYSVWEDLGKNLNHEEMRKVMLLGNSKKELIQFLENSIKMQ